MYCRYRGVQTNKEYPLCLVLYSFARLVFFADQQLACNARLGDCRAMNLAVSFVGGAHFQAYISAVHL